jgi:RHS repeat-associated protein
MEGDIVLEQVERQYDANGNVILVTSRQRFHDETATGALGDPQTGPKARVSYVGSYYDASDRLIATVNVGTNGGTAYERPAEVPARSETVLVSSYGYRADEVQEAAVTGGPTGGSFTLSFGSETTAPIAFDAPAADVQFALEALAAIGVGNVRVVGPAGGPWVVRFVGDLAGVPVAEMLGDGSGLTGGVSPSVSTATTSQGGDAGRLQEIIDPRGIVGKTDYDLLGRAVRTIEAFIDLVPSGADDQTTAFSYDGSSHLLTLSAWVSESASQVTQYVYGVTTAGGSAVNSNDLLVEVRYPDKLTGQPSSLASDIESYNYNALGQTVTRTDRNGSVHAYSYDVIGRMTADAVTALGAGVDGAVLRLETAYDTAGRPFRFTSYDAASGGNAVNQVERVYNGLSQLITEYQELGGAVNTGTSPSVQYAYSEMAGNANHSRLVSMTYPSGRVVHFIYGGVDDSISRLSQLADDDGMGAPGTVLEEYAYLGLGTVVRRVYPEADIELTYIGEPGDAGDPYRGLDRFGRVVEQLWQHISDQTPTDHFAYGHDRNGNRLFRENLINAALSELYHGDGAAEGYDLLNQLTAFARGTLNSAKDSIVGTASRTQEWDLDALGNWATVATDQVAEEREHNAQNQLTGAGGAVLTFDGNGNMTTDERGQHLVYDAWNRLVRVVEGETVLVFYAHDGLNRRVTETRAGVVTDLYYSDKWQVLEEHIEGGVRAQFVWSPVYVDAMVLRDRDTDSSGEGLEERLYVQQDANWNVTALVERDGDVAERFVYDPYGSVTVLEANWDTLSSSAHNWVYLHQGGRFDGMAGLYHFRYRDLSPSLGRWVQRDPIELMAGDPNFYRSLSNDPIGRTDPLGLTDSLRLGLPQYVVQIFDNPVALRLLLQDAAQVTALALAPAAIARINSRIMDLGGAPVLMTITEVAWLYVTNQLSQTLIKAHGGTKNPCDQHKVGSKDWCKCMDGLIGDLGGYSNFGALTAGQIRGFYKAIRQWWPRDLTAQAGQEFATGWNAAVKDLLDQWKTSRDDACTSFLGKLWGSIFGKKSCD